MAPFLVVNGAAARPDFATTVLDGPNALEPASGAALDDLLTLTKVVQPYLGVAGGPARIRTLDQRIMSPLL